MQTSWSTKNFLDFSRSSSVLNVNESWHLYFTFTKTISSTPLLLQLNQKRGNARFINKTWMKQLDCHVPCVIKLQDLLPHNICIWCLLHSEIPWCSIHRLHTNTHVELHVSRFGILLKNFSFFLVFIQQTVKVNYIPERTWSSRSMEIKNIFEITQVISSVFWSNVEIACHCHANSLFEFFWRKCKMIFLIKNTCEKSSVTFAIILTPSFRLFFFLSSNKSKLCIAPMILRL